MGLQVQRVSTRGAVTCGAWIAAWALQTAAMAQTGPELQPLAAEAATRATFVSTGSQQWNVVVDGEAVCSTPCSGPLTPFQFVALHSQEWRPVLLEVGRLPPGDLVVSGEPFAQGMYAGGIVATTFGGMATAVGITFTAVGLAKDRDGMTTAGMITGAAGVLTLSGGLYLMLKALPSATIYPAAPAPSARVVGVGGRF